ncbi:hypothetical protein [uncultured Tessaracoccus sp.]|uniref:hypothetical protein n=1 Tax=uncultured Tessaracoccus sp. TaxID=905023 RepID=UPI002639435A|nr:hypothetical protein [uncultured Tessaracoccus sp.]
MPADCPGAIADILEASQHSGLKAALCSNAATSTAEKGVLVPPSAARRASEGACATMWAWGSV